MVLIKSRRDKREGERCNKLGWKKNNTAQVKQTTRGKKNTEGSGERRKTKKISRKDKNNTDKRGDSKAMKKFYLQVGEACTTGNEQPDPKETKVFKSKIWERREHRKAELITNREKQLDSRNDWRRKYPLIDSEQHSKQNQIAKHLAMMAYRDTGLKTSLPSIKKWLSKWIGVYKKQTYPNRRQKERLRRSWKTPRKRITTNYRPITCQPSMWKILRAQIMEDIYDSLINCGTERMLQRATGEVLHIDQHIFKDKQSATKKM